MLKSGKDSHGGAGEGKRGGVEIFSKKTGFQNGGKGNVENYVFKTQKLLKNTPGFSYGYHMQSVSPYTFFD